MRILCGSLTPELGIAFKLAQKEMILGLREQLLRLTEYRGIKI